MNELVSVIIPVYNVGEILKESVNSLLLGEYQKIEILIVDDGSDEQTARMCDDISTKDERIKVIHQQNMGVSGVEIRELIVPKEIMLYLLMQMIKQKNS